MEGRCLTTKASTARPEWAPEGSHPALPDFTRACRCQHLKPTSIGRDGRIRTCVLRLPGPAGDQTAPRPVRRTRRFLAPRAPSSRSPVQFSRFTGTSSKEEGSRPIRATPSSTLAMQLGEKRTRPHRDAAVTAAEQASGQARRTEHRSRLPVHPNLLTTNRTLTTVGSRSLYRHPFPRPTRTARRPFPPPQGSSAAPPDRTG